MNAIIIPSQKNPQFYISNTSSTTSYFIDNFLFSGNTVLQFLSNIIRTAVPDTLAHLLFKAFFKTGQLPPGLSASLGRIKEFITDNKDRFSISSASDIAFIIRMSAWQRTDGKFVIIIFKDRQKAPVAIAKVEPVKHNELTRSEFNNAKKVYKRFSKSTFTVPEPVALYITENESMYFERALSGTPFNNYLKTKFTTREKENIYLDLLDKCGDIFTAMNSDDQPMTAEELNNYFYSPIDFCGKTALGKAFPSKLKDLRSQAEDLQAGKLFPVSMHGDLWGGSILYNKEAAGIIDWEFFSDRGVPLWDFFSIAFHIGTAIENRAGSTSDFMNYFTSVRIAQKTDDRLIFLAERYNIKIEMISFLFQSYLLFNMENRDTAAERYWQHCLEIYWNITIDKNRNNDRIL